MRELTMTAAGSDEHPSIRLNRSNSLANLHASPERTSSHHCILVDDQVTLKVGATSDDNPNG
jgi:hypothetical protein